MHSPNASSQHDFPHTELVESVLGVSLPLQEVDFSYVPDGRQDLRAAAYNFTLAAVKHHVGIDLVGMQKLSSLPDADLSELSALDDARYLRGEVLMANHILRGLQHGVPLPERADDPNSPRAQLQAGLLGTIATHFQTLPADIDFSPADDLRYRLIGDGLAVISPVGSGKTPVESRYLRLSGIGQLEHRLGDRDRAIVTVPTQKLVEQYLGESGNNTFRDFLGNEVHVTAVYGKRHNPLGEIVLTTPQSVHKLEPRNFLRFVVDEGQSGLSPTMLRQFTTLGIRPILFTATPAYTKKRDLRNFFAHIETRTLRQLIEEGILNPTRVLSFLYDDDDPSILATSIATAYVRNGRRVVVFCQPGKHGQHESFQARYVASLMNEIHGGRPIAESVGSHNPNNDGVEDKFDRGGLSALTTVRRLGAGWDADVDVGIFIGSTSELELTQEFGRIVRPGKHISEAIELLPRSGNLSTYASLWRILDLENVDPDQVIGPVDGGASLTDVFSPAGGNRPSQPRTLLPLDALPALAREQLVTSRPVRSIFIDGRYEAQEPPEHHHSIDALAGQHNVPVAWLQTLLDAQEFSYVGVRTMTDDLGEVTYSRWYEDAAADFLETHPMPELAAATDMTVREIARMCGVSHIYIEKGIQELELTSETRLTLSRHLEHEHYNFEAVIALVVWVESTPIAGANEVPLGSLGEKYGYTVVGKLVGTPEAPQNGFDVRMRWRNPVHGIKGLCLHISAEDAERVREHFRAKEGIPEADPDLYISQADMAREAGLSYTTFDKRLTAEEKALGKFMRKANARAGLPGNYFLRTDAAPIIERVGLKKLPAHLVHAPIFDARVANLRTRLAKWLREVDEECVMLHIIGGGRQTPCLTWQQLRKAEERFGIRPGEPRIDYDKVVQGEFDDDPERRAYSQKIQSYYFDRAWLDPKVPKRPEPETEPVDTPDTEEVVEQTEPKATSNETAPTETTSTAVVFLQAGSESIPPLQSQSHDAKEAERRRLIAAAKGPRTMQQRPASKTAANPEGRGTQPKQAPKIMPENYVEILAYLREQGAECEPSIVRQLARQQKLPAPIEGDNESLWGSDETALALEQLITRFPIADEGMYSPSQIVALFPRLPLQPGHIGHVAAQVASTLEGNTSIRRSRNQDGSGGKLDVHYAKMLSQKIIHAIRSANDRGEVRSILQYGRIRSR